MAEHAPGQLLFQSTPPSREATRCPQRIRRSRFISIYASLAGGDEIIRTAERSALFQSTPPSREATVAAGQTVDVRDISIHASLAGGDKLPFLSSSYSYAISIHASLAGGDQPFDGAIPGDALFQSTPPSREATVEASGVADLRAISIHASLAGGD
mgnify:CR=1 FL=1